MICFYLIVVYTLKKREKLIFIIIFGRQNRNQILCGSEKIIR